MTPEWMAGALCRLPKMRTELWYPKRHARDHGEIGKAICERCPVRTECLNYALANRERFGIWGGLSERQRRRIRPNLDFDTGVTIPLRCIVCDGLFDGVRPAKACPNETCQRELKRRRNRAYLDRRRMKTA